MDAEEDKVAMEAAQEQELEQQQATDTAQEEVTSTSADEQGQPSRVVEKAMQGVSVGSLGHVLKKTFKDFFNDDGEEELAGDADAEAEADAADQAPGRQAEAETPAEGLGDCAVPVESAVEAEEESKLELELVDTESKQENQQIKLIDDELQNNMQQAALLEKYLEEQHVKAYEKDKKQSDIIYSHGLLPKVEFPLGRSNLEIDEAVLGNYDHFSNCLLMPKQLLDENEKRIKYRRGETSDDERDENSFSLRPTTPQYLKSTATQNIRLQLNKRPQPRASPETAEGMQQQQQQQRQSPKKKQVKVKKKGTLSVEELHYNTKMLQRMKQKVDFLKNPRHVLKKERDWKPQLLNLDRSEPPTQTAANSKSFSFQASVDTVHFTHYAPDQEYERKVSLCNGTRLSARLKILPPTSKYFAMEEVRYPSGTGTVAPGMSVSVTIRFLPVSLGDYADYITVITETDKFRVAIRATRVAALLDLPLRTNIGSCLMGNRLSFATTVRNDGGTARFRLFSLAHWEDISAEFDDALRLPDELWREFFGDSHTDTETETHLRLQHFIVKPAAFSLERRQQQELSVSYLPRGSEVATHSDSFVVLADNCVAKQYSVTGNSCYIDLRVASLNHCAALESLFDGDAQLLQFVQQPEYMMFERCTLNSLNERVVQLHNKTSVELAYSWVVKTASTKEDAPFAISPSSGTFEPDSYKNFIINFTPKQVASFSASIKLVIHAVPSKAVRRLDDELQPLQDTANKFLEQLLLKEKAAADAADDVDDVTDDVGDVAEHTSEDTMDIPFLNLKVSGSGVEAGMAVEPRVTHFPGSLLPHKTYTRHVTLRNPDKEANLVFSFAGSSLSTSDAHLGYTLDVTPNQGVLPPGKATKLAVNFTATHVGDYHVQARINYANGPADGARLDVCAEVRGAVVTLDAPLIQLGLIGVREVRSFSLPLTNRSDIPCSVTLSCLEDGTDMDATKCSFQFEPASFELQANEQVNAKVVCQAGSKPERLRRVIQCAVKNSQSRVIAVKAEVQSPKVFLDTSSFDLGVSYVTVAVSKTIRMTNLSNLVARYRWSDINQAKNCKLYSSSFDSTSGQLQPKETRDVVFTYTPVKAGRVGTLFVCDVEGMARPIGFALNTVSKGLSIGYTLVDEGATAEQLKPAVCSAPASSKPPILAFGEAVPLNQRAKLRLCVTNHSGIPARYNVSIKEHAALAIPASLGGKAKPLLSSSLALLQERNRSLLSNGSGTGEEHAQARSLEVVDRSATRLSDQHEASDVFTSVAGRRHFEQQRQRDENKLVLGEGMGVGLLALPNSGTLHPWSAVILDIICFNSMPGRYKDELVCDITGLPPVRVPIQLRVTGLPLQLQANTVGLSIDPSDGSKASLQWRDVLAGTAKCHKVIKVCNNGPVASRLAWQVIADRPSDADLVQVSLRPRSLPRDKRNSRSKAEREAEALQDLVGLSIQPHCELSQPPPFDIQPQQQVVSSYGTASFRVSYHPAAQSKVDKAFVVADAEWVGDELNNCASVASLGSDAGLKPNRSTASLASKSSKKSGDSLKSCMRLALSASSTVPELYVDRSKANNDGEHLLRYQVQSTDIQRVPARNNQHGSLFKTLTLRNTHMSTLACFVATSGPFEICKARSSALPDSKAGPELLQALAANQVVQARGLEVRATRVFTLAPNDDLAVTVKYRYDLPRVTDDALDINRALLPGDAGEVLVVYENDTSQVIKLHAQVLRPTVVVQPSCFAFATTHVETRQSTTLYVSNPTVVPARFKLVHVDAPAEQAALDDVDCWSFSAMAGCLNGPTLPLESAMGTTLPQGFDASRQVVQIQVTFQPRLQASYCSRFRFVVETGIHFDVVLSGDGSYQEHHDTLVKKLKKMSV